MKLRRTTFWLVLIFAFGLALSFADETADTSPEPTAGNASSTADTTSPSSTGAPTTSSAPSTTEAPPKVQTFKITGKDNTTCLLASMILEFTVPYETKENKTKNAVFYLPEGAEASGSCGGGNESQLWLSFFEGKYELNFTFSEVDKMQTLQDISLLYELDDDRFPGHAENGSMDAKGEVAVALSPSDKSYSCQSAVTWTVSEIKFSFTSTQIQAFNVEDGKFSDATVCPGDVTTPVPTTPAPTPLPEPEKNHYVVSDDKVACLLLDAAIQFEIPYNATDGNETTVKNALVNIPNINDTTVVGKCGNMTNSIEIDFYDNWSIHMIFTRDANYTKSGTFTMQSAQFSFVYDKDMFPDIDESYVGEKVTADGVNLTEFTASIDKSYLCKAEQKITLQDVTMHTWNLHVEPFRKTNDTASFSAAEDCAADEKTSDIVPIAVGCALAALVVIVLVAYLIGRKRNARQGYQTV